ncbi:MAG: GNAT family N-acetyltransferase [Paracoccus sp. (in: a-proteobacteria)]|uniref:GNAT family N-acetyltransferase n=1 Tax=Paracoccus sp. TaxID=267 RepID=UPI0026DFF281|nr:GNAT family N-acetyltransferase [Paracoccus sp. (in: a-proteobacteria)]MDO5613484.1 GNAT family N-acetyltransferase [Paracoccus sp. (in: a-proteobacteria)]
MTGCACGHHTHHAHHHPGPPTGTEIAISPPLRALSGRLICADMDQMLLAMRLLPDHITASRAEPGCLRFDLAQDDDPMIWHLNELFADEAAFAAHQSRTQASPWGQDSTAIRRDFAATDTLPRLRPETRADHDGIAQLLRRAFDQKAESDLVANLRADDDMALSLVAEAQGTILGHIALSPVSAAGPALALAPVAVHPALHGRGIGSALIRAAIDSFADHTIIALGDPAYYRRFGFAPADLASPYAGPHLMTAGPKLPANSPVTHAAAFARL